MISPGALNAQKAAEYLGISPRTLEDLERVGELYPVRITTKRGGEYGRKVWRVCDLDAYLARLAQEQHPRQMVPAR